MSKLMRIISACTAGLLIIALSVGVIILDDQRRSLEQQIYASYDMSIEELGMELNSLKTKLDKLEATSGTSQRYLMLMDVWRQTGNIQNCIATMPVSYKNTSSLTQFINRIGDYCYTLCQKLASGEDITDDELSQLKELAKSCEDINACLDGQQNEFALSSNTFLADDDANLDFTSQQYARLQYDGPFSESTENKEPKGLGSETIDAAAAKKAAAEFLEVDENGLMPAQDLAGKIECFGFSGEKDGIAFSIYITKTGGKVLWYMSEGSGGISAVPTDSKYFALTKVAKEFLKSKGYGETAASYAQFYNGMAVINLAPVENGVVLYPDLIKVWVDISKQKVAGIDAYNYLMSHVERDLQAPLLSLEAAASYLNKDMQTKSTRVALIPLDNGVEVLCYEFTGQVDKHDYIIYINAENGREEDILMIQHTNEGTLVM